MNLTSEDALKGINKIHGVWYHKVPVSIPESEMKMCNHSFLEINTTMYGFLRFGYELYVVNQYNRSFILMMEICTYYELKSIHTVANANIFFDVWHRFV